MGRPARLAGARRKGILFHECVHPREGWTPLRSTTSCTVVLYYVGRPLPFGEKRPPQNQQQEIFSFFPSLFFSLPPNFLGRLQLISYPRTYFFSD